MNDIECTLDVQCARCGSSISIETCDACDGSGFYGHGCGEDCCSCAEPEDNAVCDKCNGHGSWGVCLSSAEWCVANPRPGREGVQRHTIEEFTIGAKP